MPKKASKTHWLQSANKNYLGHWDLPNGEDLILTIKSANEEAIKNPKTGTSVDRPVIRFEEDFKPLICNATNAKAVMKSTGEKFMEDCVGKRIKLTIGKASVGGVEGDCIRIKETPQESLSANKITAEQAKELTDLLTQVNKNIPEFCQSCTPPIKCVEDLPALKFAKAIAYFTKQLNK